MALPIPVAGGPAQRVNCSRLKSNELSIRQRMKTFSPHLRPAAALTALILFASFISTVNAGLIDVLRSEGAPRASSSFQRVAFVGSARVKEVQGEAERLVGIDVWRTLEKGTELAPGDLIRTRSGTVVVKMHESGSYVKVTPHTILRLVPLDEGWDRSVLSGREEKSGFIVRSCRGKASVRGSGGEWKNVEVNAVLAEGSELWTEPGTVIDLFHNKQRRPLRVQGSTRVKLNESTVGERVLVRPELVATLGQ